MTVTYRAEVRIAARPEAVWAVWTDATRFPQWQGAVLECEWASGPLDRVGTEFRLRMGPGMTRTAVVVESEPPHRHRIRQRGMGAEDDSSVAFEPVDGGMATVMRAEMRLSVRFGVVGRALERVGRGESTAELVRELERFAAVVSRPRPELDPGRRYSVDSGAGFRLLDVHELEGDVATVSPLASVGARRPHGVGDLGRAKPLDALALQPLGRSIRATARIVVEGQPAFLLDGGHGTYPFRATIDLLADARPGLLRHEVAASPVGSPPTAVWGREVGLRFAPW